MSFQTKPEDDLFESWCRDNPTKGFSDLLDERNNLARLLDQALEKIELLWHPKDSIRKANRQKLITEIRAALRKFSQ